MRPAVFLDRDGVLNRAFVRGGKPYPPGGLADFELLPGVGAASAALRAAGYDRVVVTNQPDVGSGKQRREVVEAMHRRLLDEGLCDDVRVCYHTDADGCDCRKPRPGMLLAAARERGIDLARSWMVGDRWRDVGAGRAAGCRTCLIDYGYAETPDGLRDCPPDVVVASLVDAAARILRETTDSSRTITP